MIWLEPEDGDTGLVWRPACVCGWQGTTHRCPDAATDAGAAHECTEEVAA